MNRRDRTQKEIHCHNHSRFEEMGTNRSSLNCCHWTCERKLTEEPQWKLRRLSMRMRWRSRLALARSWFFILEETRKGSGKRALGVPVIRVGFRLLQCYLQIIMMYRQNREIFLRGVLKLSCCSVVHISNMHGCISNSKRSDV